jgi:hypothetical protein
MIDEQQLIRKLHLIEALHAGTTASGERVAAAEAMRRIRARLAEVQEEDPPVEYKFSLSDMWSRRLFVSLLRRYEIRPYRYYRQRHTTVMARVSRRFVDETLWPEFQELNSALRSSLDEMTDRVIREGINQDDSEAEVRNELPADLAGS